MKYFLSSFSVLAQKIRVRDIKSILLHGLNTGLADTIIQKIVSQNNLTIFQMNIKELTANTFYLVANNKNLFQQRQFIKITGIQNNLSKEIQQCLIQNDFEHFVCFHSTAFLPSKNNIRYFFEYQKEVASMGCYYEYDDRSITQIIIQECKKHRKNIDKDALLLLKSSLKVDNCIIKSELKKLFSYTHDKSRISRADIISILSSDLISSNNKMCVYFITREADNFVKEVIKLKKQNQSDIFIIRRLSQYYLNIYIVLLQIMYGQNINIALKSLLPSISFQDLQDFKNIIKIYTPHKAVKCLQYLQQAEIDAKNSPQQFDLFFLYTSMSSDDN